MVSEPLFTGSPLEQLNTLNSMRDSLKLSYPELDSVANQYHITNLRIFPYLGYDNTPLLGEDYIKTVTEDIPEPINEDNVSAILYSLATPIREDYLRIALNYMATPIREDYLRLALNALARPIRDDVLRVILNALVQAIREDALRTALNKFNNNGYPVEETVTSVSEVLKTNKEFIKYSPMDSFDITGDCKMRYMKLKDVCKKHGEVVRVLDKEHYEVPLKEIGGFTLHDYSLFMNGYMGTDGDYSDDCFDTLSIEHVFLPVYDVFNPCQEKVPRDYWVEQARQILNQSGWSKKNIKNLSWWNFKPYKGKKPSAKMIARLRYVLLKEMKEKNY